MRKTRLLGSAGLLVALLLVGAQALHAGASKPVTFGALLTPSSQPSNAEGGQTCEQNGDFPPGAVCTWVAVEAYHNGGHERAPKTGTIGTVSLISCVAGSFRLEFATANRTTRQGKLLREGPVIRYRADPRQVDPDENTVCGGDDGDDYIIQSFPVNIHMNQGNYFAIRAASTGALYCSGGNGTLLYNPPLAVGKPARKANDAASCDLLVQLTYK